MKFNLKYFTIIAFAVLAFTGCQKEEILLEQKPTEWKEVVMEKSFAVTKAPYLRSLRYVFINDGWGQAQQCRAITFTDVPTGKKQEWLFIDAHSQAYNISYLHPNETNTDDFEPEYASDYGGYYEWAINFATTTSWDGLVYSDASLDPSTVINGFKIPTFADLDKLGSILGSTSLIPSKLSMNYDGLWSNYSNYHFSTDIAAMWVHCPGDPNVVPGCGVVALWKTSQNNVMTGSYTNMTNLGANIRIVRDIQ